MEVNSCSRATFIYPMELDPSDFDRRIHQVDTAEFSGSPIWQPHWKKRGFVDDNFLPHIGRFLNPEDDASTTARVWRLDPNVLQSPAFLAGGAKNSRSKWFLKYDDGGRCPDGIEFRWLQIQLVLFRVGIGFLIVSTKPVSNQASVWQDFIHYFRFAAGQRKTSLCASRKSPAGGFAPWFAEIANPLQKRSDGQGMLKEVIDGLLMTARIGNEVNPWFRDVYTPNRLMPFTALYYENVNPQLEPETLFRTRRFFYSAQPILATEAELDLSASNASLINYAQKQWFAFSKEGVCFVAMDIPDDVNNKFFFETLPSHLANHYLLTALVSLYQRFALLRISEKAAEYTLETSDSEGDFTKPMQLNDRWSEFMTIGYFNQVAQTDNHHRFYAKCQEVNNVDELFSNVRIQIEHLYSKEISNGVRHNINNIAKTQHVLHIVEYLIAAFYGAELIHLIDHHGHVAKLLQPILRCTQDFAHGVSIVLFAILGLTFVELVNRRIEGRWLLLRGVARFFKAIAKLPSNLISGLSVKKQT